MQRLHPLDGAARVQGVEPMAAHLAAPRHLALMLDLYATSMTLTAIPCMLRLLRFLRDFDLTTLEPNRQTPLGTSRVLGLVAAFCIKSAAGP